MNPRDSFSQDPLDHPSEGLAPDFTPELDAYERRVAMRIGAFAAHAARTELAAHLDADFEARIEMGIAPEAARLQALAALGDPRRIARSEPLDARTRAALLCVPVALIGAGLGMVPGLSEALRSLSFPLQITILLGPSMALGFWAGTVRGWPNLRAFFLSAGATFGLSAIPMGILFALQSSWSDTLQGLGIWGAMLLAPGLVGMSLGKMIGTLVRMPGQGRRTRTLGLMRLLAPGIATGLGLIAFQTKALWLHPLVPLAGVTLVGIGMLDRRRLDGKAIVVGVSLALLGLLAWCAIPGKGYVVSVEDQLRHMPEIAVRTGVILLILQALALGAWTLLRRFVPLRRGA